MKLVPSGPGGSVLTLKSSQRPSQRRHVHVESCCNGTACFLTRSDQLARSCDLRIAELAGPADMLAVTPRGGHASFCPLADHRTLELGKRGQHVEIEPPAGARRVDLLLQRSEADLRLPQRIDHLNKMRQGAAEPVELPDDENIAFLEVRQRVRKSGPLAGRA